jgi:hypothetical protein
VDKAPIAAYLDQQFAQQAKERLSTTFIAHIHFATAGGLSPQNTHPSSNAADCSLTTASSEICRVWKPSWVSTGRWWRVILIRSGSSR